MNIKVIAACLACTALSLSACSSSVNCSECGKALDVSADTYVMQSGSPFCGEGMRLRPVLEKIYVSVGIAKKRFQKAPQ